MTHTIRIISETADTVTIDRSDFEALVQSAEDAEDLASLAEHDAEEARLGRDAARRDYLSADETEQLLDGQSPVKIWRGKRGLSQRALAAAAGMQPGYLGEIETGRKPGSADALRRLSGVLGVAMQDLLTRDQRLKAPDHGPVLLISTGRLAGSMGPNDSPAPEAEFPTNEAALDAVRVHWLTLQHQYPFIADKATRRPIYDQGELYDEMAASLRSIAASDGND